MGTAEEYPERVLTESIIGAAITVHRSLGPGLLESAYEHCLARELEFKAIPFERQVELPITYRGERLDCGYRLDLVIRNRIILELKSAERLLPIHEAQLLSYLRLSGMNVGLLINFNVPVLRQGIRRKVL
jgi:GxxExxY protein